ncbi:hypothetical protein ACHAWO_011583 [Cyclotella atomus]|uniref:Thioredoxin reductase n=1 Tax=Cyclotella atomus TaxID=382360 RepID=A0ABD3NWB5_9STRA
MTTRLRRKVNRQTPVLPISSPKHSDAMPHKTANQPSASIARWPIILASMLIISCLGMELLSGKTLHPKAKDALKRASHHVERISRQMKESTPSISKRYVPRDVQYLDINTATGTFDVVVVGCGPSGLTSALFASRMGMSVLVLGSPASGSLSGTDSLDNFPSYTTALGGRGWLELTIDQAIGFGAKFAKPDILANGLNKTDSGFQLSLSHSAVVNSRTVIIASGSNPRKLNLQYEEELWGSSIHNCALCDGDAYTTRNTAGGNGKTVVVIGGGDAAVEAVSLLARIGVQTIHWIHRREDFRANAAEVERVKVLPNVQLWTSFVVTEWIVEDGPDGKKVLNGVKIVGSVDGVADPEANSSLTIPCDGAFLMIGSTPNTKWLESSGIEMDDLGLVRLQNNENVYLSIQTTIPGVFAAGEAIDGKYRQALTAASDGAKSAMDAERYLRLSATPIVPILRERGPEQRRDGADDEEDEDESQVDCDLTEKSCISKVVSDHPVVIFSKSFCSYCHRAKEAMEAEGAKPLVFELDFMGRDGRKVQEALEEMTGRRTVPNVFVGGKSIGGGSETVEYHESGMLKQMLLKANAIHT